MCLRFLHQDTRLRPTVSLGCGEIEIVLQSRHMSWLNCQITQSNC